MASLEQIQARAAEFLRSQSPRIEGIRPDTVEAKRFTPFRPDMLETALERTSQYMEIANSTPDNRGLERVMELAEIQARDYGRDLIKYALMVFITHHRAKGSVLPIPPLEERSPDVFLADRPLGVGLSAIGEDALAWFREDPLANAHHEHWHVVYPHAGIPDEKNPSIRKTKDRQGELFFYMHQQMLARYDTERLAVGLDLVKPLEDYSEKLYGYDSGLFDYSPRPNGMQLVDLRMPDFEYSVKDLDLRRQRLAKAVNDRNFDPGTGAKTSVDINLLGATEEASIDSASSPDPNSYYGNHHNFGHVLIAYIHDPSGRSRPGVMAETETAIRDPIFYRWHKAIDELSYNWQETQKPYDFSDAPDVMIRKKLEGSTFSSSDIILAFKEKIPGAKDPNFNWYSYADENFGESKWGDDFSSHPATTDQLETYMDKRQIDIRGQKIDVNYLDQREFVYFIRAENLTTKLQPVTVRIFLVAKSMADNRRMWIEMDKFFQKLGPGKTVIFRDAKQSSVIKKPAFKPPQPVEKPSGQPGDSYCPCGWPYNLLVPRGKKSDKGMEFRLMVMLTDWNIDKVPDDSSCGSMSYCGARNSYPDARSMGYPFDKPFLAKTITQTIVAQKNIAARDISIQWK